MEKEPKEENKYQDERGEQKKKVKRRSQSVEFSSDEDRGAQRYQRDKRDQGDRRRHRSSRERKPRHRDERDR